MRVPSGSRSSLRAQQCLYFLPLPQGQGSLRPGRLLTRPPLLGSQSDQRERVDAGVEQPDTPMQVRARDSARRARQAE